MISRLQQGSKSILLITMLLVNILSIAQDSINFDQAIGLAIQNNFLVKIINNNVTIAENQSTRGNAGLLPEVNASGSLNYGINNTKIQLQNSSDVIETKGAEQNSVRGSVDLNYTLFSGFSNTYRYHQLMLNVDISEVEARAQLEDLVLGVANAYCNVLRTRANLDAVKENLVFSRKRLQFAETKNLYSGGSKLDVLNAQVDYNQDSVTFLQAEQANKEAKLQFKALLNGSEEETYLLLDNLNYSDVLDYDDYRTSTTTQNSDLVRLRLLEQNSLLNYKIAKSAYIPRLNMGSSYSYNSTNAEGSFLRVNQSDGLSASLSLTVPIFTGGKNKMAIENTKLQQNNAELQQKQLALEISTNFDAAFSNYLTALKIYQLEKQNITTAQLNYNFALEQFKQGSTSSLNLRESQVNLLLAKNSLNNASYDLKLTEYEILRLSGNILPQL